MLILFRTILFIGIFSTIILTEEDVHEAIPVGSDIESAVEFLNSLRKKEASYRSRENAPYFSFLDDDEAGYWIVDASVKRAWWDFPLGRFMVITVVVSDDEKVSRVEIRYRNRFTWP
jgi:hypothetical protein